MCYTDVTILAHNFSLTRRLFRKKFTAPRNADTYSIVFFAECFGDIEYFYRKL
jgi:hypothetical protein